MWRKFRWVVDRQCHNRVFFGDGALSRFLRQDYSFDAIVSIRLRRFINGKLGQAFLVFMNEIFLKLSFFASDKIDIDNRESSKLTNKFPHKTNNRYPNDSNINMRIFALRQRPHVLA